ncbi:MAG: hypothetical protein HKN11_11545 [Rhizobiales bacterium]|nr:hypothetical protein [Hyphomicrobiales bacterium]
MFQAGSTPAAAKDLSANKLCISRDIVTNALGNDPGRYAANLSWFPSSRQKLGLLVSLIVNFGLCGKAGEADRLYEAAARITKKVDKKARTRLMKRARHYVLVSHLRSGDMARLATHLDDADGHATSLFHKATRIGYAVRTLHDAQIEFDARLAGRAVVHWLQRQPGHSQKAARKLNSQAGRLAATFVEFGYLDGAAELAVAFPDRSVSRKISRQKRKNDQEADKFAKAIEQLSSRRADDLIDGVVAAAAKPRRFSKIKRSEELVLDQTYRRLLHISAKLKQNGKPELIAPLLQAASRHSRKIGPLVCKTWFLVRLAGLGVATGNEASFAPLISQLPMDQGNLALPDGAKCGDLPVFYYANQRQVLDTFASGIAAITSIPPFESTGVMDPDFFTGTGLMFGETSPLFDHVVVVAFYRRAAQLVANKINGSLMLPAINMADRAFRTGYTAAALELTEISLRHTIEWKRRPGHTGNAVPVLPSSSRVG